MKKISSIILRISITLLLLIFLFSKTNIKGLSHVVQDSDARLLVVALLFFIFLNFLVVLRWQSLLRGLSVQVGFLRVLTTYLSSMFFNLILPSTIGGDFIRTLDMARYAQKHSSGVLATVVLDRVGGFFGLMTVLSFALIFGYRMLNEPGIIILAFVLLGIILFLIGIAFSSRFFHAVFRCIPFKNVKDYLCQIHKATASFKDHKDVLLFVWFLSCVCQAGLPFMYYLIAKALGVHIDLIYFFIFVPVIMVISVIPISIGGLGVRDTACVVLFGKMGMVAEKAFALSLINFGFIFIIGVFGGLLYVVTLPRRRV